MHTLVSSSYRCSLLAQQLLTTEHSILLPNLKAFILKSNKGSHLCNFSDYVEIQCQE